MALPLLPAMHIMPAFRQLQRLDSTPVVSALLNYVQTTWLAINPLSLPIASQSEPTMTLREGISHVPVDLLFQEAETMTLQLHQCG